MTNRHRMTIVRGTPEKPSTMECGTCDRSGPTKSHPCRFEVACSCWRGVPCDGSGRIGRKR